MADWKKLSGSDVKFDAASWTYFEGGGGLTTYIEYDADRTTPTETYIRFRGSHAGGDSYASDSCLVFYNPNNNPDDGSRKLYTIKTRGGEWSDTYNHNIKITKAYNASKFYIQDYWICNNGAGNTAEVWNTDIANAYKYFNEDRANYVQKGLGSTAYSIESSTTVATANTAYSPTITDNGNNTFTITAKAGTAGTNNKVNSTSLKYMRKGTDDAYVEHTSLTLSNKAIAVANDISQQVVYARTYVTDKFGNTIQSTSATCYVKHYVKPGLPGTPTLAASSKKNGRLTVKQNWTYTWTAATQTNDSSPVKGYRIRIYKNGTAITGLTCSTSNNTIGKGNGTDEYVDRESTSCTITFNPNTLGFKAGDTVYVTVNAYTRNGQTTRLWSGGTDYTPSTVQNAGIVHVKVSGRYKEGQVYVKVSGSWKEANSVHTKVNGAWKESQ